VAALVKQPWMVSSNKILPAAGNSPSRGRISPDGIAKAYSGQGSDIGVVTPKVQEAAINSAAAPALLDSAGAGDTSAGGSAGCEEASTSGVDIAAGDVNSTRHGSSPGGATSAFAAASAAGTTEAVHIVPHAAIGPAPVATEPGPVAESAGTLQPPPGQLASMASGSGRGSGNQGQQQQQQEGLPKHNSVAFSVDGLAISHQVRLLSTWTVRPAGSTRASLLCCVSPARVCPGRALSPFVCGHTSLRKVLCVRLVWHADESTASACPSATHSSRSLHPH
jgi:hypothetical protein